MDDVSILPSVVIVVVPVFLPEGFATMWTGLEVAAKNITVSVASETVNTVKHK